MLKKLEHRIKATVFAFCRLLLKKGRRKLPTLDPSTISKVLFLRPEKIGDMVISLRSFDALRLRFPHIRISLLASPRNLSLIKSDPRFDKVFLYRKRLIKDIRTLLAIRREKYDCVLDMIDDDSVTTLFYSQLAARKAVRIGIGKERHARYYDFNHVHGDGIGQHIVENTLKLLVPFGINGNPEPQYAAPHVSDADAELADDILASCEGGGDTVIGLNLSAGMPNRIWPSDKSVALVNRLLKWREDVRIIVIVAPGDRQRGEELLSKVTERTALVPDGLNLSQVSALIARLNLLISPDTSLLHIARSFDVPVVGLYNRAGKNFRRWQPYRQPDGAIVGEHIDTIYDIEPDRVFAQVQAVLKRVEEERRV
jgi:ADP-heptose:LPS heptosyltransferase